MGRSESLMKRNLNLLNAAKIENGLKLDSAYVVK